MVTTGFVEGKIEAIRDVVRTKVKDIVADDGRRILDHVTLASSTRRTINT